MSEIEWTTPADGIALLTLNRPERRNALSANALTEFHRVIDEIAGSRDVRVVIVTGAGQGFCSGADMKATAADADRLAETPIGRLAQGAGSAITRNFFHQELMAGLFEKIHRLRQPVIAAVNGAAHGGGFALALACDIRVAAEGASFGAVFINRGVSNCDMGTSYHLPRLVGAARSAELMLTGRVFDAAEAERIGLVTDVVPASELTDRALQTARQIAAHSPLAMWMTKETMWQTIDAPSLRHALDIENRTQIMCTATGDITAAFTAFREGRTPEWTSL